MTRAARVYQLDITYPEGSHEPGWRPDLWSDPAYLRSLDKEQRRRLRRAEFRWPRERMFLSSSGAYGRAWLLRAYGADVEVLASDPVTWPNYDDPAAFGEDAWERGATAMRWSADLERIAGRQRAQLAEKIRSGDLPFGHALEILGEPEARELADLVRGLPGAVLDEAAKFSAAARGEEPL